MSIKVKLVHLVNYCGYTDTTFDFTCDDGSIKDFTVFYGPNGIGKTTCMRGIQIAANPMMFRGRERDAGMLLRKSIYDEEYLPHVDAVQVDKVKKEMLVEVLFDVDGKEKAVIIDNDGLLVNELPPTSMKNGYSYFADADNPINTQKFLLSADNAEKFLDFCRIVYGYKCELVSFANMSGIKGYTDFVIHKGKTKVHFKSMSAGEKKIATLISDLCQPVNTDGRDILMIDNVEMHVYFKRHARMIDKLRATFPGKQIITTSHSDIVIGHVEPELHFDLEQYRPDYKLFDDGADVEGE